MSLTGRRRTHLYTFKALIHHRSEQRTVQRSQGHAGFLAATLGRLVFIDGIQILVLETKDGLDVAGAVLGGGSVVIDGHQQTLDGHLQLGWNARNGLGSGTVGDG